MMSITADMPVQYLRGVGPIRARQFASAGIARVWDLLKLPPKRYERRPACQPLEHWQAGQTICVAGEITQIHVRRHRRPAIVSATVAQGVASFRAVWFNTPQIAERLERGHFMCATGKLRLTEQGAELANPSIRTAVQLAELEMPQVDSWVPVYAAIDKIKPDVISRLISTALEGLEELPDFAPPEFLQRHSLCTLNEALRVIHKPASLEAAAEGRKRLAYSELLVTQLCFESARRMRARNSHAPALPNRPAVFDRIKARLPFELTESQSTALREIMTDMGKTEPMLRLLQGDVGAGKTAVAFAAALLAVAHRKQVAFLAPTEILAQQHFKTISDYLVDSRVSCALLTGGADKKTRTAQNEALAQGDIHIAVGTHALLSRGTQFEDLALVIVDEQHRFGVKQREALINKGRCPHYVVLSATPIPRTMSLAYAGDLDVSIIGARPRGRGRIQSALVDSTAVATLFKRIRTELDVGRQAYFVYPLIETSETLPLKAVASEFETLSTGPFANYRCALLHGRMKPTEKAATLERFNEGELQILVSTSVIEVGIDVPNATIMAVFNAERYGLSQLHQLRGRVGRWQHDSQFFVVTDSKQASTLSRLQALIDTEDGFKIAMSDLETRGPGEMFGTRQHGVPEFIYTDFANDLDLVECARQDAHAIAEGAVVLTQQQQHVLSQFAGQDMRAKARLVFAA